MDNAERRKSRSSAYQNVFLEAAYSNDMMSGFSNEDSISGRLNPFQYNEELIDLEEELKIEFWRLVETLLTDRQKEVLKLSADGLTQMEIAKILHVNQSSIVKSLQDASYKDGKKTIYGGSKKRLKKLIDDDPKIKDILDRINKVRENKW